MDGRRRQWVPIASDLPWTRTGHNLQRRFGRDGLLVWILVLAAAKKAFNQGTFEYVSEFEGWRKLGLENDPPEHFTLKEFFTYTGQLKTTRRDRRNAARGRQVIEITAWKEWNLTVKRQLEADKKSRKRGQNTGDIRASIGGTDSDLDLDLDSEVPPYPHSVGDFNNLNPRAKGTNPRAAAAQEQATRRAAFVCPNCGLQTQGPQSLREHLDNVHGGHVMDADKAEAARELMNRVKGLKSP